VTTTEAREREARLARLPFENIDAHEGFFRGTVQSLREIWSRRELLGLLVRREIKARYKDSSLGIVWSLIRPLAQLLIYYFAIGQVLGVARGIPGFAIFVFVGLTGWTLFSEIITNATTSIVNNAGLVRKVYLPREIFPLASTGSAMFSLAIQLVVLLAATVVLGQFPWSIHLLYFIPSLALLVVFASALGILLAAVNVYLRDFQHLVEVGLIIFFWASPIVYSFSYVTKFLGHSWVRELYLANPITLGVLGMQKALWVGGEGNPENFPDNLWLRMLVAFAVSLVLLFISQRVFARLQGNFAQEL
jgi:ABC-2 type transport system permease protein